MAEKLYHVQDYLKALNEAQRAAVEHTEGPSLVIAGAGSGKTRVLTYRIAHILEKGIAPGKVLALTFTNKAAKEMKERIGQIIGKDKAVYLWMGTFHSIFARILRANAEKIGYPSSFTIYDTQDSKSIVKKIIKDLKLGENYKPRDIFGRISKAKNNLVTPAAYEKNQQLRIADEKARRPEMYRIYKLYTQRCFEAGAMDFDDLLMKTNILFRDNPDVLAQYQERFQYIMVDEYQDTNYSQYLIVKKLAEAHHNLCVVGDDAQSIYGFRGAKIENILNFQKDYKEFKEFKLERNYRSTSNIVEAANSVIKKNKDRIKKKVFAHGEEGNKIKIIKSLTDNEEGFKIVNYITDSLYQENTEYGQHAILYRTNAQSRIFEEALRKRNIPYKIYGGTSFYQRKEIKDLLAYFKLTVNSKDNESLKRVINYPKRGIGATTIDRLENYAQTNGISIWETILKSAEIEIKLNSRALNQIHDFAKLMKTFMEKAKVTGAYETAQMTASDSGVLKELFSNKAPKEIVRHENVQELLNGVKEFSESKDNAEEDALNKYLEDVALLTDQDGEDKEDQNKVSLMTIHSSKGLEFRNVYIVGVEERLFPSEMTLHSPKELEEERRLFYVAVTRAEKELYVSYAGQRYRWGQLYDTVASRFIDEIDEKFIDNSEAQQESDTPTPNYKEKGNLFNQSKKSYTKKKPYGSEPKAVSSGSSVVPKNLKRVTNASRKSSSEKTELPKHLEFIKPGAKVSHAKFGAGEILSVEGNFPNSKAKINFAGVGEKTLLLKFAKLNPA